MATSENLESYYLPYIHNRVTFETMLGTVFCSTLFGILATLLLTVNADGIKPYDYCSERFQAGPRNPKRGQVEGTSPPIVDDIVGNYAPVPWLSAGLGNPASKPVGNTQKPVADPVPKVLPSTKSPGNSQPEKEPLTPPKPENEPKAAPKPVEKGSNESGKGGSGSESSESHESSVTKGKGSSGNEKPKKKKKHHHHKKPGQGENHGLSRNRSELKSQEPRTTSPGHHTVVHSGCRSGSAGGE